MKILAIDTATEGCSAALWIDGSMMHREEEVDRGHADRILPMVDELLAQAATTLGDLDALAFGRGPGSFTGVRLAASVTQGLAFGARLPVVAVSDLQAVALQVLQDDALHHALVCNDARMREVYWGCFSRSDHGVVSEGVEAVGSPGSVQLPVAWQPGRVIGAGRGFAAYPQLRGGSFAGLARIDDRVLPRAREIALLAVPEVRAGRVIDPQEAIPVYLRNDVARAL